MFEPRRIDSHASWLDADGVKLYTISAHDRTVEQTGYRARLAQIKTGIDNSRLSQNLSRNMATL